MLAAMDGSRALPEVVEYVRTAHPEQSADVLRRGAAQLLTSGYVEDVAGPLPAGLTERDLGRYDRAVRYFRWLDLTPRASSWEPQARLREARVTILGLGGTGGVAALALAASGVGHLHCVDRDTVELSNLSRQILYTEDEIEKPKADAAVARLRRLNSDIRVTGQRLEVTCTEDVLGVARVCDVLLLAADRPAEVRTWTNRACLAAKRPWVDAGYHGPLIQAGAFVPGEGRCWECSRLTLRDQDAATQVNPDDAAERGAAVANAVAAASAGISGYLAAHLVISLLTGVPPVVPGRIDTVNLAALGDSLVLDDPPHPRCEACRGAR
jgi:molybdopterin/thiamine biosynthesis adenylyltransferase